MIEIEADNLRVGVLARLGGSLTHVIWRHPAGHEVDVLRRSDAAAMAGSNPSALASFIMLPFANRIDGGRIPRPDGDILVPVNRPEQNVAIHGFGRHLPWQVLEHSPRRIRLELMYSASDNPYRFRAEHEVEIREGALHQHLDAENLADRPLPYGLGFHPWLDRTADAELTVDGTHIFTMDDRQMPVAARPARELIGRRGTFRIEDQVPFDTPLADWSGAAIVTYPGRGARVRIDGAPGTPLLHVFAPVSPPVLCLEPVSHMPDVVNRRPLARHGDMRVLATGQRTSVYMRLMATAL